MTSGRTLIDIAKDLLRNLAGKKKKEKLDAVIKTIHWPAINKYYDKR